MATEFNNFISENESKLINMIPFSFTDHYDVYHLNCTDEKILNQSGKEEINNMIDYAKLSGFDKYYLILMLVLNKKSIETL